MAALVSIVTPVFNAATTLEEAARSVRSQSLGDWEWLITDDASTDGSWELIQQLAAQDPRIKPERLAQNGGASRCRNASLKRAEGRYIAFLDADDLWLPQKLERQLRFMQETSAPLSFTGFRKIAHDGVVGAHYFPAVPSASYQDLLRGNPIACLTAMYDRQICGSVPMDEKFRARMDYICWLEITKRHGPASGLNEDLGRYRISLKSLSANKAKMAAMQWRVYRDSQKLGLARSAALMFPYALQGFKKSRRF